MFPFKTLPRFRSQTPVVNWSAVFSSKNSVVSPGWTGIFLACFPFDKSPNFPTTLALTPKTLKKTVSSVLTHVQWKTLKKGFRWSLKLQLPLEMFSCCSFQLPISAVFDKTSRSETKKQLENRQLTSVLILRLLFSISLSETELSFFVCARCFMLIICMHRSQCEFFTFPIEQKQYQW